MRRADRLLHSTRLVLLEGPVREGWVRLRGERIAEVGEGRPPRTAGQGSAVEVEHLGRRVLAPGFVDLHVHGGGGGAFTDGAEAAGTAIATHRAHGTTTLLASLVTDGLEALAAQIGSLVPLVERGELAGIHLEGPWLAASRCGAHSPRLLADPTIEDVERLLGAGTGTGAQAGVVRMITLAPERDGALGVIRLLRERGIIAAIGHTEADEAVVERALEAGASVGTHLFNAMPSIHHRAPGPIPRLLTDPRATVELIADGVHLEPSVLRLAATASRGRWTLITDAMAAAGGPDGAYRLGPLAVDVLDGIARIRDTGAIAGSTLTLDRAVRFAVLEAGLDLAETIRAASQTPAQLLGRTDIGRIAVGARADLVVLSADLHVERVIRGGVAEA